MSAMDVSSVDTDDNTNEDQFDDNLLEPLTEVSFNEREKNYTMTSKAKTVPPTATKTTDKDPSSLPDSRAKMLHLQRIARSGDSSSNDTVKSASSKKRNKSQSVAEGEKEETVSFSLESIIRRGLNDQKIKSNFNSNFKFGKPDDNISLRVNPTANLFYEIEDESGTDSSSDTYESSGERENTENTSIIATSTGGAVETTTAISTTNNCITENGDLISSEPRRKRGRPKMSEEQKSLRAAQKDALRMQNSNKLELNATGPTQVDQLISMGHSMFSEIVPRKRGRPKLKREFNDEFNSFVQTATSSTPHQSQNDGLSTTGGTNVSFGEPKVLKKRGRKPKSYHLEQARLNASDPLDDDDDDANEDANDDEPNELASTSLPLITGPRRRGRKPRKIQDFYVKLERPSTPSQYHQNVQQNQLTPTTLKKKRGRKPKSYHEQMAAAKRNHSAPSSMLQLNTVRPSNQNNITVPSNRSMDMDMLFYAKRRGRKPKSYYEQLAALPTSQSSSINSNNSTQSDRPGVSFSDTIMSDGPPIKKKRGRKPKSYFLELEQRQQQQQQNQPQSILTNYSTPIVRPAGESSSHIPNNLPKKRGRKPGSRNIIRKAYVKVIPFHQRAVIRRPGIDIPAPGFQIKKKRGRKPKNYQPEMEQHNGPVETNDYLAQLPIEVGLAYENEMAAQHLTSTVDYDEKFLNIFRKQYDQICILKQRISSLNPNEAKVESTENIPEPTTTPYTNAELCKAYCLQRHNIPIYASLQKQYSIPLPSVDEVHEFVRKIQMVNGLQSTMLQMLDYEGTLIQDYERFTILQISQLQTSVLFEYDDRLDRIWGHHKKIYMIVARGLYKEWSQLVYLSFDTPITKSNLFSVIETLHKINYPVVAVSTSYKEKIADIYTELSIGYGKNFFMHPIVPQKIFCFYYLKDLLEATNQHFSDGHLTIEEKATRDTPETRTPINKQTILLAIQGSYRRISIPREVLAWTDTVVKDLNFLEKFYSQFTLNMLQLTLQDNNVTKAIVEFVSIIKTYSEMMRRTCVYDSDSLVADFGKFIDSQNRKINRFHDRIFKIQDASASDKGMKFRDAMLMSIVSLTMLRKSILEYYKYPTFSTAAITDELVRTKMMENVPRSIYDKDLSPMQVHRALKMIFLGDHCEVKAEPKDKLFYPGAVTAAEVNGKNEAFYVSALLQWLCDEYTTKHPNANPNDVKDFKRKLKKTEEHFCRIQNPNFRITENVVAELTTLFTEDNATGIQMDEILQIYIIQRLLLRIEYFNQNNISRIPNSVQMSIDLE